MRAVTPTTLHDERPFDYFCPICGASLAEFEYERSDADYACPGCGTQQRASKVPAGRR